MNTAPANGRLYLDPVEERAILGALIDSDPEARRLIAEIPGPSAFFHPDARALYSAIEACARRRPVGEPIPTPEILDETKHRGVAFDLPAIMSAREAYCGPADAAHLVGRLVAYYGQRQIRDALLQAQREAEESLDAETILGNLQTRVSRQSPASARRHLHSALHSALISGATFAKTVFPERRLVIGSEGTFRVHEGGLVLISAPPALGKTTLASQLTRALTLGKSFFDIPVAQTPVLFVSAEEVGEELQGRFRRIFGTAPFPEGLHVLPAERIDGLVEELRSLSDSASAPTSFVIDGPRGREILDALGAVCQELGVGFVVFDPLAFLIDGDENDNTALRPFLRDLTAWARRTHVVACACLHDRKPSSGGPGRSLGKRTDAQARVRGGTAIPGAAHLQLSLSEGQMPGAVRVTFGKVREGRTPDDLHLRMDDETGLLVQDDRIESAKAARADNLQAVYDCLLKAGRPLTAEEIHARTSPKTATGETVSIRTTRHYLTTLRRAGRIVGPDRGQKPTLWWPAAAGDDPPTQTLPLNDEHQGPQGEEA